MRPKSNPPPPSCSTHEAPYLAAVRPFRLFFVKDVKIVQMIILKRENRQTPDTMPKI
jgi:hypothetical protein